MNVKESVAKANSFVAELFADEGVEQIGLEEVRFLDDEGIWLVTIGFSRRGLETANALARLAGYNRVFKTVTIDDDTGEAVSVTDRRLIEAH